MIPGIFICFWLFGHNCVSAAPLTTQENEPSVWSEAAAGFMALAVVICIIKLLAMCTEFCQKNQVYKEFSDPEDTYNPDMHPSPVAPGFSMYPPTENTPDIVVDNRTSVVFEPLPDLSQLRPNPVVENSVQLRPKMAIVDDDNDDDIEEYEEHMKRHDPAQDAPNLQRLVANNRNGVPREQISYIKELGNGWFGQVLQGEGHNILPGHKKTKIVVQMLKEDADIHDQLAFIQEATPYRDVDHVNVLKLLGQCVDTTPYLTVLELCTFGDLKSYLRNHRVAMDSFNEKGLLLKFASEIAAGLQALHDNNIVHRDFAARNCLLASDLSVKIGDYGLAEEMYKEDYLEDSSGCGLPIRWLSPECVSVEENGKVHLKYINKNCNIWSFGITLWEILTFGNLPYGDLSNDLVLRLVIKERSLRLNKPDANFTHLDRLYELMQLCWSHPARSRPSLRQLRIMLLHLLSNKMNTSNNEAFETKWNKLLPRKPPQVVSGDPVNQYGYQNGNLSNGGISSVTGSEIGAVPYSEIHSVKPIDKYDIEQLNAAKLNGSQPQPRLGLSLEDEFAQLHRKPDNNQSLTSPINELSLAAELSGFQTAIDEYGNNEDDIVIESDITDVTPTMNESDLEDKGLKNNLQGLYQSHSLSASVDSQMKDELQIFDSDGKAVNNSIDEEVNTKSGQDASVAKGIEKQNNFSTPNKTDLNEEIKITYEAETPGRSESILSSASAGQQTPSKDMLSKNFMTPVTDMDFITSTPKKDDSSVSLPVSGQVSASGYHADSEYHTAFSTQMSTESTASSGTANLSQSEDERSFLGQKKFAAILQTVVTSFDNEDDFLSPSFGEMSFDAIAEEKEHNDTEVFESEPKSSEDGGGDNTVIVENLEQVPSSENTEESPDEEKGKQK